MTAMSTTTSLTQIPEGCMCLYDGDSYYTLYLGKDGNVYHSLNDTDTVVRLDVFDDTEKSSNDLGLLWVIYYQAIIEFIGIVDGMPFPWQDLDNLLDTRMGELYEHGGMREHFLECRMVKRNFDRKD